MKRVYGVGLALIGLTAACHKQGRTWLDQDSDRPDYGDLNFSDLTWTNPFPRGAPQFPRPR